MRRKDRNSTVEETCLCNNLLAARRPKAALQEWQENAQEQENVGANAKTFSSGTTFPSARRPQYICLELCRIRNKAIPCGCSCAGVHGVPRFHFRGSAVRGFSSVSSTGY